MIFAPYNKVISMKNSYLCLIVMLLSIAIYPACNTSRATKGAVIGAGAGGAAAAVLAKDNKAAWIIAAAAVGGVAGGLIGNYMDKQAASIEQDLEDAEVERVGEGIVVTFDSGILFDVDSYALKSATRTNLQELATSLKKYDDTEVQILGHTDNTGSEKHNQTLSERRADAVNDFLIAQQVTESRLSTKGYGESDPIASDDTVDGRQQNRRVEIVIVANKKLQREAKNGDMGSN